MHICWWCQGRLIWDCDFDAEEYFCDEGREGVCTFLHCSECEAVVTYTPPERWE